MADQASLAERIGTIDRQLATGEAATALPAIRDLLTNPQSYRVGLTKGVFAHLVLRNLDEARLLAERLARLDPPEADGVALLGLVQLQQGDRGALESFNRALAIAPLNLLALQGAARAASLFDTAPESAPISGLAMLAGTFPEARTALVTQALRRSGPVVGAVWAVGDRLVGFALDRSGRPCGVEAEAGGVVYARAFAGMSTEELPAEVAGHGFSLSLPVQVRGQLTLQVRANGVGVLGSPVQPDWTLPPRLVGTARREADSIIVQARDSAGPHRPIAVQVIAATGSQTAVLYPGPKRDGVNVPGELRFPVAERQPAHVCFAATGEPVPWARDPDVVAPETAAVSAIVDIVVPVYRDEDVTRACLESVFAATNRQATEIVVVDDGGPEPALRAWLQELAAEGRITLLPSRGNLGFVRSVNRGMALHPDRDVILLNSDTVVHGDWVDRIARTAMVNPQIGTVTPLSNDATILSWPTVATPTKLSDLPPVSVLDSAVAGFGTVSADDLIALPTAVGFCMYIRRACLDAVGWFDAETFGDGYGEENDFCCRASGKGWLHVPATDVFVGHVGGVSFGPSKQKRIDAALAALDRRHGFYLPAVHRFLEEDPLRSVRRRLDMTLARGDGKVRVMLLAPKLGGGTDRFVKEVLAGYATAGQACAVVRPARRDGGGKAAIHVDLPDRPDLRNLVYDGDEELQALIDDLTDLGVVRAELHHPMYLEEAGLVALTEHWPYTVRIHDYVWICPRVNLVDPTDRYCGEPSVATCEACVRAEGHYLRRGLSVAAWRAFTAGLLTRAEAVVCSTPDSATRMARYVPGARYRIEPPQEPGYPPPERRPRRDTVRICIPGAIGTIKGYDVLLACAADAAERQLPLEFVVVGYTKDDGPLLATGRVAVTGAYREDEALDLVRRAGCDAAFLPSIWPETWCYTLGLMWQAGLRVFAFDLGAQAERIRDARTGWLLPRNAEPSQVNNAILAAFADR